MATNALSYMKNVAKSFGYAFADNFNEMNPTVSALFRETKDLTQDLYESIADFKGKTANVDGSISSQIKDTTKEIWNNLNSDLRTGKWYNKARKEKAEMDALGSGFGIDFDDFGDFDFDDDETELDEQASIQEDATKAMAKAMDVVGGKTANAISTATVNSANYIVQSSRMNTRALYALNVEGFGKVSQGIAAVNTNISTLVKLGEPLTKHMQNSSVFFSRTNEYQEKSLKLLEQLVKNTSPRDSKQSNSKRATTISDLFTSEGILDVAKVKDVIKNGGGSGGMGGGELGMMLSMMDMFGGPMGFVKAFTGSPLSIVLPMLTGQLFNVKGKRTGKSMRDAFGDFNKALSGAFAGGIAKLQDTKFGDGILGSIGKMIQGVIPKSGVKERLNPKSYNQGPVDWDGQSRMALMHVIPTQLGKIVSLLSGQEEVRFDYRSGRWVKVTGIYQMRQIRKNAAVQTAGGDLLYDLRRSVEHSGMNQKGITRYNKELSAFFEELVMNDNTDFLHIMDENFDIEKYRDVISPEVFRDVQQRLREIRRRNPAKLSQLARNVYSARSGYGRGNRDVDSLEMQLENDSLSDKGAASFGGYGDRLSEEAQYKKWKREHPKEARNVDLKTWKAKYGPRSSYYKDFTETSTAGASILSQTDRFGKDQLFYLRGIYESAGYIAKNLKYLVPGGKRKKGTRIVLEPAPVVQLSNDKTPDLGRETVELEDDYDFNKDLANNSNIEKSMNDMYGAKGEIDKLPKNLKDYYYAKLEDPSKTDDEMEEKLNTALKKIREGKGATFASGIDEKINKKWGKFVAKHNAISNLQDTLGVTSDEVATILGSVTESLNGMIYGKDEQGISLMDSVKQGVKNIFDTITLHISDYIPGPIKDFFKSLWDSDFVKDIRSETKKTFKNMFKWFFKGNKEEDKEESEAKSIWTSDGRGEPGDANHDADGNAYTNSAGGFSGLRRYISMENRRYNKMQHNKKFFGKGAGQAATQQAPQQNTNKDQQRSKEYHTNASNKQKESGDDSEPGGPDIDSGPQDGYEGATKEIVHRVSSRLVDKFQNALTNLFGKNKPEEERKKIRSNIEGLMKDVGGAKGAIGAGALTGAGISLITGAFVGPIAGAAIGASVGFITKSETAQNILFGEQDKEKGGRKGGVFSKTVSDAIYKYAPSMGKGAAAGLVGGTLLGSPVIGAIVGSSIGFVSSSDKAKDILFGEMGKDGKRKGGLISKDFTDKIKKAVPRMAGGAALMTLLGPAVPGGLVGKLLVGSALGFATTTNSFKEWFFGKDKDGKYNKLGKGGFSGLVVDKLFNPVIDIFKNLSSIITNTIKETASGIGKTIRNIILGRIGKRLKRTRAARAIGRGIGTVANKTFEIATSPVRGVSNFLRGKALAKGYDAYQNGKLMTVEDRLNYRKAHPSLRRGIAGRNVQEQFDASILNDVKDDKEALIQLRDNMARLQDWRGEYKKKFASEREKSQEVFQNAINAAGGDKNIENEIIKIRNKYLRKGESIDQKDASKAFQGIKDLYTNQKISKETYDSLMQSARDQRRLSINYSKDSKNNGKDIRDKLLNEMSADQHRLISRTGNFIRDNTGTLYSDKELGRFINATNTEINRLNDIETGKTPEVKIEDNTNVIAEEAKKHTNILYGIGHLLRFIPNALGIDTSEAEEFLASGTGRAGRAIKKAAVATGKGIQTVSDKAIDTVDTVVGGAVEGATTGAFYATKGAVQGTVTTAKLAATGIKTSVVFLKNALDTLADIYTGEERFETLHEKAKERKEEAEKANNEFNQEKAKRMQETEGDESKPWTSDGKGEPGDADHDEEGNAYGNSAGGRSGIRSNLYRKLRKYGIGAGDSDELDIEDDQSEAEMEADAAHDSVGEDSSVKDSQFGGVQENNGSKAVQEKKKRRSVVMNAISNIPVIGGGINKITHIAQGIYDNLVGNAKKKKESIFTKLLKIVGTIGGGLLSIFGFGGAGNLITNLLGGGLGGIGSIITKGIAAIASSPIGLPALLGAGGVLVYKYKDEIYDFISNCIIPPFIDTIKNSSVYKAIKSFFGIKDEEQETAKETLSKAKEVSNPNETYKQLTGETIRKAKEYIKETNFGKRITAISDRISNFLGLNKGQDVVYQTVSDKDVAKIYFEDGKVPSYIPSDTPVYKMDEYINYRIQRGLNESEESWNKYCEHIGSNGSSDLHSKSSSGSITDALNMSKDMSAAQDKEIDGINKSIVDAVDAFNPLSNTFDPSRVFNSNTGGSKQASSDISKEENKNLLGGDDAVMSAGASGAIAQAHGIGKGAFFNGSNSSVDAMEQVFTVVRKSISNAIGMDAISNTTISSFSKNIQQMQDYSLQGNTQAIWKLDLDINRSKGVIAPFFGTMYDLNKTMYSMLSIMTGLLTPMNATIAGVQSGLEYISGANLSSEDQKSGNAQAESEASNKSSTFASKAKATFNKIKKSFKSMFGGASGSGLIGMGAGGSGLYPLYGLGGGKTVKDTQGKETEASPSVSGTSNLNLDYGGNDVDHPFTDQIWSYLKSIGFSDHAAAGIMGNIRAESGGDYAPYRVQYRFSDKIKGDSSYADIKKKYENWGVDFSNYHTVDETLTKNVDGGNISLEWFKKPRGEGTQDGYGISQFTFAPYKEQLYNRAKEKKTSVGNLAAQLDVLMEQLKASGVYDPAMNSSATYGSVASDMLLKYEKPDNASSYVDLRTGYAKDIYEKYKGTNPNTLPVYGKAGKAGGKYAGSTDDVDGSSGSEGNNNSSGTGGGDIDTSSKNTLLDKIKQAFYNGFMILFGGDPDKQKQSSSTTTSTTSTGSSSDDEVGDGDASPNNPFAGIKKQPYQIMQGWKGKLVYSQAARDPHQGSSDCSSTVQAAILDAGGPDVGSWTNPQADERNNVNVVKIDTGGITEDEIKLVPNDILLYQSNYSLKDPSYIRGIGHAAMYVGNGKMIEQTSRGDGSKGTYESNMRYDRLVQVNRVKPSKVKGSKASDDDELTGEGGGASGFKSQLDPAYSNIRVGGKSMADNGCGPTSAAMALGSLGRGINMKSAANLANQYQTTGGTDAAYFKDIFNRNGIGSSYVTGKNVKSAVASGAPVVLMGQDRSNRSKANSPFGPNNHYVVARGMDKDGNVNIADPESGGMHKYSSKILNNVKVGVAATGSKLRGFGGKFGFGAGKSVKNSDAASDEDVTQADTTKDNGDRKKVIWDYLRSVVGLSEAGAAGVMGCWQEESHNDPDTVEGCYLSNYPGTKKVFSNPPTSLEEYTTGILWPAYAASGLNINKEAYKMDGKYAGHYAPGLGLGQWTGPRASHLMQYADDNSVDWRGLAGQLKFFVNGSGEFKSKSSLYDKLKKSNSVDDAVASFYKDFESGGSALKSGDPRWGHAHDIYNKYKGSNVTTDLSKYSGGVTGSSSGSSGDDDSTGTGGTSSTDDGSNFLQKILTIFSNAFTVLFGGDPNSTSDGTTGTDGTSSSGGEDGDGSIGSGGIGAADGSIQGAFIDYATSINQYMLNEQKTLPKSKQWRYGNKRSTTFEDAVKRGVRETQCDGGVCWIVRHFGVIGKHESHNTGDPTGLPSLWEKLKSTQDVHIHPNKKVKTLMAEGKLKGPTVFRTHGHCFMYLGDYGNHSYWWDTGHKSQGYGANARFGDAHKGGWIYKVKKGNCINGDSTVIAYYNIINVDEKYLTGSSTVTSSKNSVSGKSTSTATDLSKNYASSSIGVKAAQAAMEIAQDNTHGYNNASGKRLGNPDYACSSFVADAWRKAGIDVPLDSYTNTMKRKWRKYGFSDVSGSINLKTGKGLQAGDVLINPGVHTEIIADSDTLKMIGARGNAQKTASTGVPTNGKEGDQTGGEINSSKYRNSNWKQVLRYTGGAKGSGLNLDYRPSASGRRLLLDNSGRFSGGSSSVNTNSSNINNIRSAIKSSKDIFGSIGTSTSTSEISRTANSSRTITNSKTTNNYGISKETAAMLKVIITLVEQLVTNTEKVDNIYEILEQYCKNSGNSDLENAVTKLGASGSGTKKDSTYVPLPHNTKATISSLADLKDICNKILVG